jgi:hypothetical protein
MPYKNKKDKENYLEKNKERIRQNSRRYYLNNIEKFREKEKKYRTDPKRIAYRIKYRLENKEKSKDYKLKKNYGISIKDYKEMLKKQNYKCSLCNKIKKSLSVDHDHDTGKVRELLCFNCNIKLGHYEKADKVKFEMYIKKHNRKDVN